MRVAVLAGGPGGESVISHMSADAVMAALDTLGWSAFRVDLERGPGHAAWPGHVGSTASAFAALAAWRPDVVFIAMHGAWGEDGRVQGLLDMLGLPYQGSGVLASATAMDKIACKAVYRREALPVAAERILALPSDGDFDTAPVRSALREALDALGAPLVLKTPGSGSSVGVAMVDSADDALAFLTQHASGTSAVLAEAFVQGREFTCPVLEGPGGTAEALPIIEIRPKASRFFDFGAKYAPDATDELCPAPIEPSLEAELRRLGLAAHRALGCEGYSRTDAIVSAQDAVVLLETNTLPGLTPASLLPKSARVHGLTFVALVETLLRGAIRRGPRCP